MLRVHFCALQEYIEGKTLAQMTDMGWQPSHHEVQRIAAELLGILALHTCTNIRFVPSCACNSS